MSIQSPIIKNSYRLAFILFVIISTYLLFITFTKPFLGIEVQPTNGQWVVQSVYYEEWAEKVGLVKGTAITQVNGVAVADVPSVKQQHYIFDAQEIVYQNKRGENIALSVHITDIPSQFYAIFFIPAFYFMLTIAVAIFLYFEKRKIPFIHYLILFQMTCSLAYVSVSTATRNNIWGSIVIGVSMLAALILLIQFLKQYFAFLHIKWPFIKRIEILYILPLVIAILTLLEASYPAITVLESSLILTLFLLLFSIVLYVLFYGYVTTRIPQIKLLLSGLVAPFLPFVLLFLIPEILGVSPILQSEFAAIFLLFIPLNFLFIQMTERLFDLQYHISRIRYYSNLALLTALTITALEWLLTPEQIGWTKSLRLFAIVFVITVCLLFIKERIDFQQRKILFTTHGDSIHSVYTSIHRIGRAINHEQVLELFKQEVKEKLTFKDIQFIIHKPANDAVDKLSLKLGEIKRHQQHYYLLLHQTSSSQFILKVGASSQIIYLKPEEIVWLELMAIYIDIFLGNLTHIEKLLNELKKIQAFKGDSIPWLDKVVWQIVEKEKGVLAQELHDTILQEQLHLARQLDSYISSPHQTTISLEEIRDQLVDASFTLREYCENLHPPYLDTPGFYTALKKLINKVKIRADFTLHEQLEELTITDPILLLMIYRLIQELLNNAIKHSQAQFVSVQLLAVEQGFQLLYKDNGIGLQQGLQSSGQSMGIQGMQERVKAFNGTMNIETKPNEGLKISICCMEK